MISPRRSLERAYDTRPKAQCARRSKVRAFATVLALSLGTLQRAGAACTTAVGAEVAEALPARLDAVTTTRNVEPASDEEMRYVLVVRPGLATHDVPARSQDCHWYPKAIGAVPLHVPGAAVSVWPGFGIPAIVGMAEFVGGCGAGGGGSVRVQARTKSPQSSSKPSTAMSYVVPPLTEKATWLPPPQAGGPSSLLATAIRWVTSAPV